MKLFRKRSSPGETFRLYYASDIHGSDLCWRKFLGAGNYYKVQALIMGGDLTGKAVVPITKDGAAFSATFLGETRQGQGEQELEQLLEAIRYNGMYPWLASAEEITFYRKDDQAREELFERVLLDELKRWIERADERMAPYGIPVYVMGGNDDPWSCDPVLASGAWVSFCDDRVTRVGPYEMISLSFANHTPWHSPRELDEDTLYRRLRILADQLEEPRRAIFNLHVPPYDTKLDRACEINSEDLTPIYVAGQPNIIPAGSRAVRQIIEEVQPLISLHGHIHESKGESYIGRTLAINSGSEYNTGRIHGVVVALSDDSVVSRQFVSG